MYVLNDEPIPVYICATEVIYYKLRSVHRRRGNSEKCIWSISLEEEVNCFKYAVSEKWLENTKGWGLKINKERRLEQVGLSEQNNPLKIAKFVDSESNKHSINFK